jgi:hypothetical protein
VFGVLSEGRDGLWTSLALFLGLLVVLRVVPALLRREASGAFLRGLNRGGFRKAPIASLTLNGARWPNIVVIDLRRYG